MTIFEQPKIDTHHHVFDPARFPYLPDTPYRPEGHEIGTTDYYRAVMQAYKKLAISFSGDFQVNMRGPVQKIATITLDNDCFWDMTA